MALDWDTIRFATKVLHRMELAHRRLGEYKQATALSWAHAELIREFNSQEKRDARPKPSSDSTTTS